MKKLNLVIISFIMVSFMMCSCKPSVETITKKPGNYEYGLGEIAEVVDIETGEKIAAIKIAKIDVVKNEDFIVEEFLKYDEENNRINEDITYKLLVRVTYEFASEKTNTKKGISVNNFDVLDNSDASINPTLRKSVETEENSFLIAYKSSPELIKISYVYDFYQSRPTARFAIRNTSWDNTNGETASDKSSSDDRSSESQQEATVNKQNKILRHQNIMLLIAVTCLSLVVIGLIIAIAVLNRKRNK